VYLGGGRTHDLETLAAIRSHEVWLHAFPAARSELLRKRPDAAWRWVMALGEGAGSAILAAVLSLPSLLPPFLSPLPSPLLLFPFSPLPSLPVAAAARRPEFFFFGVGWWYHGVGSYWDGVGWCWVQLGGVG